MAPAGLFAAAAVLAAVVSLAAHVALNCPIDPIPSPPMSRYDPPNNLLQRLEKLGEGLLNAPEDVYVDAGAGGVLYIATRDGWLQRMRPGNGSWERWRFVGGTGLLGIAPSADGAMLVCDADKGLLRVGDDGVTLLASEVEGSAIRFADAAIEASDGTVYFSDASTRFGFDRWILDFLESRPSGRLLRYDPRTGETSVVLDHLGFANGVAMPRDEAFVVVCQSTRFRCTKVWLKGEKSGQAETFVDNLPGGPDNIRLGSDGSFWIALLPVSLFPATGSSRVQITHSIVLRKKHHFTASAFEMQARSPWLDFVHRWTLTKRVVASFPALLEWSKATAKGAAVVQVSEDGKIIRLLDDAEGKVINFVTSVTEYNGDLFLGSLATNFIGKLSLSQVTQEQDAVSY